MGQAGSKPSVSAMDSDGTRAVTLTFARTDNERGRGAGWIGHVRICVYLVGRVTFEACTVSGHQPGFQGWLCTRVDGKSGASLASAGRRQEEKAGKKQVMKYKFLGLANNAGNLERGNLKTERKRHVHNRGQVGQRCQAAASKADETLIVVYVLRTYR